MYFSLNTARRREFRVRIVAFFDAEQASRSMKNVLPGLFQREGEDAVGAFATIKQGRASDLTEMLEILDRARIGRKHEHRRTGRQILHRLTRLQDRQRT